MGPSAGVQGQSRELVITGDGRLVGHRQAAGRHDAEPRPVDIALPGIEFPQTRLVPPGDRCHPGVEADVAPQIESVRDIVYVREEAFKRALSQEIADEVGALNSELRARDRRYVLIGPGRWGSTDPRLGVPVTWGQISYVCCIVETDLEDLKVSPSQGSHFFHNITSFGVTCLTVNFEDDGSVVDRTWLDAQPAAHESEYVRHVRFDEAIEVVVDGHTGRGAVLKPGRKARRRS